MPITITVTDPTPEEARRAADALLMLFDWPASTTAPVVDIRTPEQIAAAANYATDASLETSEDDAMPLDTAAIFGNDALKDITCVEAPPGPFVHAVTTPTVTPPPPPPATSVETDAAGLPWDGRIHASTKSKIAGGVWRMKKGIDDATVASVTAELRAAMGAPTAEQRLAQNPAPLSVVATTGETVTAAPPPPPASVIAPPPPLTDAQLGAAIATFVAPVPGVTPPPPAASGAMTFPQLMLKITALPPGPETQARVLQAVQSVGLPSLAMLGARPDLVPSVAAALGLA